MSGGTVWILLASLVAGGLRLEPPPPRLDEAQSPMPSSVEGPTEGPALPPLSPREAEGEAEGEPPGIELAPARVDADEDAWLVPPPRAAGEGSPEQAGERVEPPEVWPDPGKAPGDGSGLFMAGGLLLPSTALWTYLLLRTPKLSRDDRTSILIAGGALGVIGVGFLALGGYRQAKLRRWANAYRVVPTRQGGALLVLGWVGLSLGLTGVPVGIYWLANGDSRRGATATAVGAVSLGLVAPLGFYFGQLQRDAYLDTGGWIRRPLPQVQLAPRLLITRGGLGVGLAGRF